MNGCGCNRGATKLSFAETKCIRYHAVLMNGTRSGKSKVRLAEVMTALSLATDLGTGQPLEFAMQSCVLAVRLGKRLGYGDVILRDIYYEALLRYIGCNAETHILVSMMGDERAARAEFAKIDLGQPAQIVKLVIRLIEQANAGASSVEIARAIEHGLARLPELGGSFVEHCEVAQRLATRIGFGENLVRGLGQLYERWDGKGLPHGVAGEAIAPQVRVVTLAQDAVTFYRLGGLDAAIAVARERRAGAYEPRIADAFCTHAHELMEELDKLSAWRSVLELEPGPAIWLTDAQFDRACEVMADFTDMKSPFTLGHSRGVADLAARAAGQSGFSETDVSVVRRAGWLHDMGRTGVSVGIWDKPGPLTEREWEQVRLHPYYTERILARSPALAGVGALACLHHERMDGSGYHRALPAPMLPPLARILAAADVYHALIEPRAYRSALTPKAAAAELRAQVRNGHLDGEAVSAVLQAAGHAVGRARGERVGGLTSREVEVLQLLARGDSIREIAVALTVAPKTIDNHIQHIYQKIGVSTRAAAALYAVEHHLLDRF
jgi:HD-GYP domain-containing protein (c-di-GMP phosphodiesterase class II)